MRNVYLPSSTFRSLLAGSCEVAAEGWAPQVGDRFSAFHHLPALDKVLDPTPVLCEVEEILPSEEGFCVFRLRRVDEGDRVV